MQLARSDPSSVAGLAEVVPADPRRRLLKRREYVGEHFETRGAPAGHGFTAENLASGLGNYAFSPQPGLRFVVLDSVPYGSSP